MPSPQSRSITILALLAGAAALLASPRRTEPNAQPPAPAYEPDAALRLFRLQPGFKIELVVAEPVVVAPVQLNFDEDGRLWVVQMPSYMPTVNAAGERAHTNSVVVLEDLDRDGTLESHHTFANNLALPRGVLPCFGGAIVVEPQNAWFAKINSEGSAGPRQTLLTGILGLENPEHAPNCPRWCLDNTIQFSQHTVGFRFDGQAATTFPTPGHGQWGLTQDDRGRLWYTPNSDALRVDLVPKIYASRNPTQRNFAGLNELASRNDSVWPSRPTPGVNRGYQEGVLRKDGTLPTHTAACGPVINRSDTLGDDARGNAFVCEPAGFMVRRLTIDDSNLLPSAKNFYTKDEFLTSTDERFRPVNSCIGPDGALYIADFSRGVIQHTTYLTPYLKGQIAARKLEAPTAMGRIWRISREDVPLRKPQHLSASPNTQLVELLSDKDGWWRDTAQRLLIERYATDTESALRSLAASGKPDLARLHALWTLDGLGLTTPADIAAASNDASPIVREASARLAERHIANAATLTTLDRLAADPDPHVRLQALFSIGSAPADQSLDMLARHWASARSDRYVRSAVLSSITGRELDFLQLPATAAAFASKDSAAKAMADDLADQILRTQNAAMTRALVVYAADTKLNATISRWLIDRIRSAQLLHTEHPKPIALDREPAAWLAIADSPSPNAKLVAESITWMDWPGRPPLEIDAREPKLKPLTTPEQALFDHGRELFVYCAGCHGPQGQGTPGQIPPLVGSPRATGSPARFAKILIHGMDGSYDINGTIYNGQMPSAPLKSDADFAAVMTFIRRSLGNSASAVSPAQVTEVRRKYGYRTRPWSVSELENE